MTTMRQSWPSSLCMRNLSRWRPMFVRRIIGPIDGRTFTHVGEVPTKPCWPAIPLNVHYTSVSRTSFPFLQLPTDPAVSIARRRASTAARLIAASTPSKKESFSSFVGTRVVFLILFTMSLFRD